MSSTFTGFAVFDLETTGLSVSRHHRVIEIGVVRLDEDLDIVEQWETLINPERDIGASDIHGLTATDLRNAPTFSELIADIWHRFEGTVPVAHNFSFDRQFILSEFSRAGIELDGFDGLCTMRLASDCELCLGARRLPDICRVLSIPTLDCHSAGNDARMCAEILKHCAKLMDLCASARPVSCPTLWKRQATPLGITRHKARDLPVASPLQIVSRRLTAQRIDDTADHQDLDEYLLVLDRVLEDRIVDPAEAESLFACAANCGITAQSLTRLHERYVAELVALALADGIVTEDEQRDLVRVAAIMGIPVEKVTGMLKTPLEQSQQHKEELAGQTVCFTGELNCHFKGERIAREVAENMAQMAGLVVAPRITKKVDILVVADPHTSSGKAKKAREYGIRIMAERPFWQKLGVEVE